ncbi:hypothetical protein B0H19DRAFT_1238233 [Mycena capillaripes]|nr:hypothetical protein B0H19DRAFT_1238233 [Mycena capillaripes]
MSKRKVTIITEDEDLNEGSDSDDSLHNYAPRPGTQRIHLVPDEAITITEDGRLRSTMSAIPTPASPAKKSRVTLNPDIAPLPEASQRIGQNMWQDGYSEFDAEYGPGLQKGPREPRGSDDPNEQWGRLDCETFLDEVLRLDGRGDYLNQNVCAGEGCTASDPVFRCSDCLHLCLYCEPCVAKMHCGLPFHHIQKWEEGYFKRCSLKSLGVRIQLGHRLGDPCPRPERAFDDDFVVITSHTIDKVGLDFCGCGTAEPKSIQLLQMRLYPATGTNPRSAATLSALRRFDHMTLDSKCSAYEFYDSLARETDNTGALPSRIGGLTIDQERYEEFLRMTRQWQHIQLLKRAGRGHSTDCDRINDTKAGECALLCPACLQPGKNLPPDWDKVPFEKAFLYALFIALDANFRLKRKDVSSEKRDPGFVKGWVFFGEVTQYMAHLDKYWDQKQERSTYLNMDYMFFMSLAHSPLMYLYVLYDIACQWYKNLPERMKIFADYKGVQFRKGEKFVVFLVPKFHLPAHTELCNILFSFNLTRFVGRTDGETPERGWADANRLANSTSISGPGARRDTLDVHFQYVNWKKIVSMEACPHDARDTRGMDRPRGIFPPEVIETWTAMAVTWEKDSTKPNPFQSKVKHESLQEVRRKLAVVASEDIEHERVRGDMHDTEMLSMGLQLEAEHDGRALATHVKHVGAHETVDQGRRRIERETKLRRKIDAWMTVQQLFIPEVTQLREREREDEVRKRAAATQVLAGVRAQDMKLWLPSAIGTHVQCDEELRDYEYQLRKGQAFGALAEMQGLLLLRTREYHQKDARPGVKAKTRSETRAQGIQARDNQAADEYRAARAALVNLGAALKRTEWQQHLKVLKTEDVQGRPSARFGDEERQRGGHVRKKARLLDPEAAARLGVTSTLPSLELDGLGSGGLFETLNTHVNILSRPDHFRTSNAGAEEAENVVNNEFLRIEWAKTRAKAMRYVEEVDLLEEEMRRVLQFLHWRAGWWRSLVGLRDHLEPRAPLREGQAAYGLKQAGYMEDLADRFQTSWKDVPEFVEHARTLYATFSADDEDAEEEEEEETGERGVNSGWLSD